MIIGIDVDGVLAPIHLLIDELWAEHGLDIAHEPDVTDFDYELCVGKKAKELAYGVFRRRQLYDNMNPDLGAVEALNLFREDHRVIAVTTPFAEHASSKWSFCQRAGFAHNDIFLCGDKHFLTQLDVLVDDKAETLIEAPFAGILFDQPWNRWLRHHPRRARGWGDVMRFVRELEVG
jgi:5'(3')-deoxyribonucleotidase